MKWQELAHQMEFEQAVVDQRNKMLLEELQARVHAAIAAERAKRGESVSLYESKTVGPLMYQLDAATEAETRMLRRKGDPMGFDPLDEQVHDETQPQWMDPVDEAPYFEGPPAPEDPFRRYPGPGGIISEREPPSLEEKMLGTGFVPPSGIRDEAVDSRLTPLQQLLMMVFRKKGR